MNKILEKRLILVNIVAPLFVGGIIYYISSPGVLFVDFINSQIGQSRQIGDFDSVIGKFIRNYVLDMLWGYALLFAIYYIFDESRVLKIFIIAFIFSIIVESVQIFSMIPGTFDIWDIFFEGIVETLAAIFIKIMRRQKSYEKQN